MTIGSVSLSIHGGRLFVAPVGTAPDDQTQWVDLGWTAEGFQLIPGDAERRLSPVLELPNHLPAFDNRDSLEDDWVSEADWMPAGAGRGIGRRWPYQGRF